MDLHRVAAARIRGARGESQRSGVVAVFWSARRLARRVAVFGRTQPSARAPRSVAGNRGASAYRRGSRREHGAQPAPALPSPAVALDFGLVEQLGDAARLGAADIAPGLATQPRAPPLGASLGVLVKAAAPPCCRTHFRWRYPAVSKLSISTQLPYIPPVLPSPPAPHASQPLPFHVCKISIKMPASQVRAHGGRWRARGRASAGRTPLPRAPGPRRPRSASAATPTAWSTAWWRRASSPARR